MKPLLLILAFAVAASAQKPEDIKEWKVIKEMSGEIPDSPGLMVNLYASQIARGNKTIRLLIRADFPWGAPRFPEVTYPHGFDYSSISRIVFRVEMNCDTLAVKPITGSTDVYQFNGKRIKSKESPMTIESGHVFEQYFCERDNAPTTTGPPTLKPQKSKP